MNRLRLALATAPQRAARSLFTPIAAVLLLLCAFYLVQRRAPDVWGPIHGDGHYTYAWARSLAYDHDIRLANDYQLCGDPWGKLEPVRPGLGPRNTWPIGPAYVWAPLIELGRLLFPGTAHSSNAALAGGCRGPISELAMGSSAVAVVLALGLGYRVATRYVSRRAALLAVVLVGLASPVRYYATFAASYSHALSAFTVAWFLERWDAGRANRPLVGWATLGLVLGFAMAMRAQTAVFAIVALGEWLGRAYRAIRARQSRELLLLCVGGLLFLACALVVFFPQLYAWKITYGQWVAMPQGPQYVRWAAPKIAPTLFSTLGGLLLYSPLLYLAFFGIPPGLFERPTRQIACAFVVVLALSIYVNAAVWDFWGSGGYPARRFSEITAVFVVFTAFFVAVTERTLLRFPRASTGAAFGFVALVGAVGHRAVWNAQPEVEAPSNEAFGRVFAVAARDVREAVGNPLAWPASLPFALRYGVHPKYYDMMSGYTAFYEDWATFRLGAHKVDFTAATHDNYVVEGFVPVVDSLLDQKGKATFGRRARLLVPMFRGNCDTIELRWLAVGADAPVRLSWNGREVFRGVVPSAGWATTVVPLTEDTARDGINEVTFDLGDGRLFVQSLSMLQRVGTTAPPGP